MRETSKARPGLENLKRLRELIREAWAPKPVETEAQRMARLLTQAFAAGQPAPVVVSLAARRRGGR